MSSDFFESQEQAKRQTGRLIFLFTLAVLGTVGGVWLVAVIGLGRGDFSNPALLGVSVVGALAVIGLGMAVKFGQMAGGGRAVALALGGRQVEPGSVQTDERRILNIVEEMSIASGVPVPPVFVMEDQSINAFAAGNSPQQAVIGVTRGCIQKLSRDELQGVIAHEFSHIFHFDTRLNMRLVAWLGGIFAISLIGRFLMRSSMYTRSSRSSKNGGGAIIFLGLGFFLIGIIGYGFGRLIQAAVCRQREFLADASAVQYTRNPDGIIGALEKIGREGSMLAAPSATEFSHFFLAEGVPALLATHPPLQERIRRLRAIAHRPMEETPAGTAAVSSPTAPPAYSALRLQQARAEVGRVSPAQLSFAEALLERIPASLVDAARSPFSARAVVCGLLLARDATQRQRQLGAIALTDPALRDAVAALTTAVLSLDTSLRLPLLQLCAASMTLLSPAQYGQFRTTLSQLIAVDGQVDRVEWMVRVVLRRAIEGRGASAGMRPRPSTPEDTALAISVLAWSGASDVAETARAWQAAQTALPQLPSQPVPAARCTLDALDDALRALDGAPVAERRVMVNACVACVGADGRTTVDEAELLRSICDSIGVPMPPIRPAA